MSNIPNAYLDYVARKRKAESPTKHKSSTWAITRQILIGVTLTLGYASFAIPLIGGFIAAPLFLVAGILTWRRDLERERARPS
jgi:hypothetical protein